MPMTDYICPDGQSTSIEGCIEACRMGERCLTLPTLLLMSKRRPWKGKISATSGLKGTRQLYLEITQPYGERPVDRAFALIGTFHHLKMQQVQVPQNLVEEWMEDELGTGMFDSYDSEARILYDYKTAGCYKVNRALGKRKVTVDVPTGEVYKTGARAGQPKTRKESTWSLGEPDNFDWRMQLSRYAWMLIDAGFPVDWIVVQVTARDYNRMTARQYGLDRQIYLIRMEKFPKEIVENYYKAKGDMIQYCLLNEVIPPPCDTTERWLDPAGLTDEELWTKPGTRCEGFCPVWMYCELGIKAHETEAADDAGAA